MKLSYLVALIIFVLGLGLVVFGTSSGDEVTLFGLAVHTRITKGIGVIAMIFSVVTFLAAYGGMHLQSQTRGR